MILILSYISFCISSYDKNAINLIDYHGQNGKYAYIYFLQKEDSKNHQLYEAELIGYQLLKFNKSIDRLLVINQDQKIPKEHATILKDVYTHIKTINFDDWICESLSNNEKYIFSKLKAWDLIEYSKVCILGGYIYFNKDPFEIFQYHSPSCAPDYSTWTIGKNGPIPNTDFLLIEPSQKIYNQFLNFCCTNRSQIMNVSTQNNIEKEYEKNAIYKFFEGNITTIQWWWNYFLSGHRIFQLHHISRSTDAVVISVTFPENATPWIDKSSYYSKLWVKDLEYLYEKYNFTLNHHQIGIIKTDDLLLPPFEAAENEINRIAAEYYPEFHFLTNNEFIFTCVLIILISFGILGFHITTFISPINHTNKRLRKK